MKPLTRSILTLLNDGESDFEQIYLYVNFDQNDSVLIRKNPGYQFYEIMAELDELKSKGVIASRLYPTYPKDYGPLSHHYRLRE